MNNVYFHNLNFSETLIALNSLYSYAIENSMRIAVASSNARTLRDFFTIFSYAPVLNYVKMPLHQSEFFSPFKYSDILDLEYYKYYEPKMIGYKNFTIDKKIESVFLPLNKLRYYGKNTSSCFQLNQLMSEIEMNKIINEFGSIDSICVGGIKTKKYFKNRLHHFDDTRRISHTILSCSYYFGIDAEIANLAGTIGIPAKMIFQENDNEEIFAKKIMYDFFYKDSLFFDADFKEF